MNWKKLVKNILYPHIAVILVLLPVSIAFLSLSLIYFDETSTVALISYLLAFYTLMIVCLRVPKIIAFLKKVKTENKYAQMWFSDIRLRMKISLYGSLLWNCAYAIFQLALGFYHKSVWFFTMFVYYVLLAVMKFFLADYTRKYEANENQLIEAKKSLICGCLLLVMNLSLSGIITLIVLQNKTFEHGKIVTISLAAYTFVTFTFAIINSVKFRKYNSLVYSSAKTISLITASVSMLTLESTMLSTFGGTKDALFSQVILSCSGAVIMVFAITMAVVMIAKAAKEYKLLKFSKETLLDETLSTAEVSQANEETFSNEE